MKRKLKSIKSQPSWVIRTTNVRLAVTRLGGHMAPVTFYRDTGHPIRPYYVSPWQGEGLRIDVPVLVPLRGDFFCLPFGGNAAPWRGEQHVCHGETATAKWKLAGVKTAGSVTAIRMTLKTKVRPGKVTKTLAIVEGQNVVYCRHVLKGFSGPMPLGHHATLAVPDAPGTLRVATSPFRLGMTYPTLFSDPAVREYQSLAIGAKFRDLAAVPTLWKDLPTADCTRFPARVGFCDLLAVLKKPGRAPAWTAAVNTVERWLWFSLKDPAILPATALWLSDRGRHGAPWNGRNRCIGLEDVCGYFAEGLAASVKANELTKAGFATSVRLSSRTPTAVNYIQGVVRLPRAFDQVATAQFGKGKVTFVSASGQEATAEVNHGFLATGEP